MLEPRRFSARTRLRFAAVLAPILVFVVALLVFSRSIENEFLPFDDGLYVTENAQVQAGLSSASVAWAFTTGHAANWHPITWLSHMADVSVYGLDPRGHHATNVLLHAINSVLVYVLCRRFAAPSSAALAVGILFAIHPLHVESVSWVSSRKDLLCAFFWLLGLIAYERYARAPSRRGYGLVTAMFVCSLLAKPVAVTFPVILLLLDFWPLARFEFGSGPIGRRQRLLLAAEKLPLFLLTIAFSAITIGVQGAGGAMNELGPVSLGARVNNALSSYAGYLAHTFWPVGLYIPYPHPGETRPAWQGLAAGSLIAALSATLFVLRRRRPLLLVGWAWFLAVSLPTLGLIQVGFQSMADRYMYLPILGLLAIAVQLGADATRSLPQRGRVRVGVFVAIGGGLCVLAWSQQAHWRDGYALFSHAVAVRPDNVPARVQLAVVHLMNSEPLPAEEQLRLALAIDPDSAQAWSNLGSSLRMQGRHRDAEDAFRRALALEPGAYAPALNLAALLGGAGKLNEAVALLESAVKSSEESGQGLLLLADFYVIRGETAKAQHAREEAAKRLAPDP